MKSQPYVDGQYWVFPNSGRRVPRQVGAEETPEEKAAREEQERKDKEARDQETPEQKAERERKEQERKDKDKDDDDDDFVRLPKKEADALRKEVAERRRKEAKAEADAKAAEEKRKAEEGKWEEIANDAKRERDEAKENEQKAQQELVDFKAQVTVGKVAQRLNFHDPTDAHKFLSKEEREGDEKSVESALKRVAREKKYLVAERRPGGGGHGGGDNGGTGLTMEIIKNMSRDEHIARKPEIDKFLASQGAGG